MLLKRMYIKLRLKILIIKYLILLLLLNITNIIDITDITKINEVKGEIPSITDFATTQLARNNVRFWLYFGRDVG